MLAVIMRDLLVQPTVTKDGCRGLTVESQESPIVTLSLLIVVESRVGRGRFRCDVPIEESAAVCTWGTLTGYSVFAETHAR